MTFHADFPSFDSCDDRVTVIFDQNRLAFQTAELVTKAVGAALDAEYRRGADKITVMITNDEKIRELNRVFKGDDEVTDVLSFNESVQLEPHITGRTDDTGYAEWPAFGLEEDQTFGSLGEIAISLPQVKRQAAENDKSEDQELAMLAIHGVLHLLGYDHAEPDEEKVMFDKTEVILGAMPWKQ